MARKPSERMPEITFIGPGRMKIKHNQVVFRIDTKDEKGIPKTLTLIKDDDVVNVEEGAEFMTGYIQSHMLVPEKK